MRSALVMSQQKSQIEVKTPADLTSTLTWIDALILRVALPAQSLLLSGESHVKGQ